MLTIQTLMRHNTRRLLPRSCAWQALKCLRQCSSQRTDLNLFSSAVLQQFYELVCLLDATSLIAPVVKFSILDLIMNY